MDKDSFEIVDGHYDKYPLLEFRKMVMRSRIYLQRLAARIIQNPIFEALSITVIVANSLFLAMDDPTATD